MHRGGDSPASTSAFRQVITLLLTAFVLGGLLLNGGPRASRPAPSVRRVPNRDRPSPSDAGPTGLAGGNAQIVLGRPVHGKKGGAGGQGSTCCDELVAKCLACASQSSIQEYCKRHPGYTGCPAVPHSPLSGSGGTVNPADLARGAACLPNGGKDLKLEYPTDAEAHFEQIHSGLSKYTASERPHRGAGYGGPWIENHWIATFRGKWEGVKAKGGRLSDVFGPYIPLLLPIVDLWVNKNPSGYRYPANFTTDLKRLLRPSVLYIIVSQNDEGVVGSMHDALTMADIPSVVVLSAGGFGHVPVPLMKQPEPPCALSAPSSRGLSIVFAGTVGHAPHKMRESMSSVVKAYGVDSNASVFVGKSSDWKAKMCGAKFSLCPRGFGRTSYRLAETVGAGRIPVFVYSDVLWVPYRDLYNRFGFSANVTGLATLLPKLGGLTDTEVEHREEFVRGLGKTHFSYAGAMEQISLFMLGRGSDLMCEILPKSTRDA